MHGDLGNKLNFKTVIVEDELLFVCWLKYCVCLIMQVKQDNCI